MNVNAAINRSSTALFNMNDVTVRDLANKTTSNSTVTFSNFYGKSIGLYSFSSITFTNASASGQTGPTLAQCTSAYSSQSWTANTNYFNVSGGKQIWTIPRTANYTFTIAGARGGGTNGGGSGRVGTVTVALNQSDVVHILVGQMGSNSITGGTQGGGGGATYVVRVSPSTTVIGIAGGGGGSGSGGAGANADSNVSGSGLTAGAYPNGGQVENNSSNTGGSGAGYSGNGSRNPSGGSGTGSGGTSFTNGGTGGAAGQGASGGVGGNGGFGGGGGSSADAVSRGGGGGGSGGGASSTATTGAVGGGGFSFNLFVTGFNSGHGYVTVTRVLD